MGFASSTKAPVELVLSHLWCHNDLARLWDKLETRDLNPDLFFPSMLRSMECGK